jgi:hypothetical protein
LVANSAAIFANAAFLQANTSIAAFGQANSAASFANGAFGQANSGASFANSSFIVANSAAIFANAGFTKANSANVLAQSAFDKANSAGDFANGSFTSANSGWTKANSAYTLAGTQAGRLDVIEPVAQAAFSNAASALQNTSVTFDGTLHIARNFSVNGTVLFANSNFSATESVLTISASPTVATPSNDGYMIHISGKNDVPARVVTDSYGTNAYALFAGRAARGNVAVPTAIQSGDVVARFSGNGYGTTKYQPLGVGRIEFTAAENFTDANTGSQIQFWNCPVGSNTLTNIATFNGNSVTFTGYIEPQKGFVYTPTVFPSSQTAITINMTTQSLVRAQTASGLVVTLSNLLAGKEVVAWITNTSGGGQTFTHGVSALNSSVNATTYNIPATSTILARYMSIDGTTQNTFVAITHA